MVRFLRVSCVLAFAMMVIGSPALAAPPGPVCVLPPAGMVSWWPGDGNASDIQGANDGTLQGTATFAPGKVGQAFSFDGVDGFVSVADSPGLDPTGALTIDAWVFPAADAGVGDVVAMIVNKETSVAIQYEIGRKNAVACGSGGGIPTGNLAFFLGGVAGLPDDCAAWVDGNGFLPLGTWTHVALTFDGSTVSTYVNGGLARQISVGGPLTTSSGTFRIGSRESGGTSAWAGLIDEVEVYDRALLAEEITSIFDAGSAGKCKVDHYLCYQAQPSPGRICAAGTPGEGAACTTNADCGGTAGSCVPNDLPRDLRVTLTDEFESGVVFDVKKPAGLCTPADKNHEGVRDPNTYLESYQIDPGRPPHRPKVNVQVSNQFGTVFVDTIIPDRLLVPTAESLSEPVGPPGPNAVDHYKCYKVTLSPGEKFQTIRAVAVADQFNSTPKLFDLKKPTRLCTPVDKNDEGIKNRENHLMCYQVEAAKRQPPFVVADDIFVNNQFGPGRLDTLKEDELCVPSTIALGP
jgi:concanavalin A-like lectin/glucanase superfamily protein